MGKVGKGEESVGGSGTGASFKELTGRKGARKGRGGVGGKGGKEEWVTGGCGEGISVGCLENAMKAGGMQGAGGRRLWEGVRHGDKDDVRW